MAEVARAVAAIVVARTLRTRRPSCILGHAARAQPPGIRERRALDLTRQARAAVDLALAGIAGLPGRAQTQPALVTSITVAALGRAFAACDADFLKALELAAACAVVHAWSAERAVSTRAPTKGDRQHRDRDHSTHQADKAHRKSAGPWREVYDRTPLGESCDLPRA
jgi:hypothetical protein